MIEALILGAVQGIAEWLPISSEAMIVLVKNNFFFTGESLTSHIHYAIFLHLGTFLAALIYFRKDVVKLLRSLTRYRKQDKETKALLHFIILTTCISGGIGIFLLSFVEHHASFFNNPTIINLLVAGFLLITAGFLYLAERTLSHKKEHPTWKDSFVTGIFQGLAAIPGVSRSGSTLASMGLLGFSKEWALRTSFILSLPLVLGANLILNYQEFFTWTSESILAIISAFVFGYLTIDILLKIVRRVRFSSFLGVFAMIVIIFTLF